MTTSLRIAIADDEPQMREFLLRVLPRLGHQVVAVAENERQLVEQCRRLLPDLIITDVKMPELDGFEACAQICRERPTPIILVSAHHDPALWTATDHALASLVKPIGLADLQPALALAARRTGALQAVQP
jgi:response regulator NasT